MRSSMSSFRVHAMRRRSIYVSYKGCQWARLLNTYCSTFLTFGLVGMWKEDTFYLLSPPPSSFFTTIFVAFYIFVLLPVSLLPCIPRWMVRTLSAVLFTITLFFSLQRSTVSVFIIYWMLLIRMTYPGWRIVLTSRRCTRPRRLASTPHNNDAEDILLACVWKWNDWMGMTNNEAKWASAFCTETFSTYSVNRNAGLVNLCVSLRFCYLFDYSYYYDGSFVTWLWSEFTP